MQSKKSFSENAMSRCEISAADTDTYPDVHAEDLIFRFLVENPVFPSEDSAVDYYFSDGRNSAQKVRAALERWLPQREEPCTILEFASGYGAVTRHAAKLLSPNVLHSSDIHPQANAFLTEKFGVKTIQSAVNPNDYKLENPYDMIFVLSFFSHMPKETWSTWLHKLYSALKPGGILLFTTHGKLSLRHLSYPTLDDQGYWFTKSSEQTDLDGSSYGLTVTLKQFVDKEIATLPFAEHLLYEQGGWWNHQDLYIVRKLQAA